MIKLNYKRIVKLLQLIERELDNMEDNPYAAKVGLAGTSGEDINKFVENFKKQTTPTTTIVKTTEKDDLALFRDEIIQELDKINFTMGLSGAFNANANVNKNE